MQAEKQMEGSSQIAISVSEQKQKEDETCQTMLVALWVKKKSNKYIDEFIDFMETIGFKYYDYRNPETEALSGKVLILFFTYNSCQVCVIDGVERPLSMDLAMLNFINERFPNFIYDFHNINPRCNYELMKKYAINLDEIEGGDHGKR